MHTNYYDSFENFIRHESSEVIEILQEIKQDTLSKIKNTTDTQFMSLREFMQRKNALDMATAEIEKLKK